ncbi:hypothetical protein EV363DRAFT_1350407 [Boletus edulis]|nr:hypothetical protein EV363DRAFT_1350407 [Boletus edulis]
MICLSICDRLENDDRLAEATDCFQRIARETDMHDEQVEWVNEFKDRCSSKLERLGDAAMRNQQYNQAIARYSAILFLSPSSPQDIFIKRGKAFVAKGLWEEALDDANQAIIFDPSSPWGYEMKHAALHYGGRYDDAVDALKIMHSMIFQSSDSKIHEFPRQYVNPRETTSVIREAVRAAIRDSPRVLINTISGRLHDKSQQALAFESLPVFKKLVSSMTIRIDRSRIDDEVIQYYQYAMLSHTWEENEPLFQEVVRAVVYDLERSPTHVKLQMFCKIVRDAGFHWAWGDTCCVNKQDHVVLQEALVAMFKWYHNSAVTIVHLRGVQNPGGLVRSLWNSRAWTLQEYLAAKVIRFYTEDWVPYMNLDIFNHKESSDIMAEMAEAARISARELKALRPGLDNIRLKLCLASRREATRVEDTAYSMLGMFSLSMPVIYGEGDKALGGLLGQLLAGSGDTSILAWSGKSGSFNSCFPTDISVFDQSPLLHIPPSQPATEEVSEAATAKLCMFSPRFASAMKLYNRLNELPAPSLSGIRIILPCITFPLGRPQRTPQHRYRAKSVALGTVEINSTEDISVLNPLYLVHPWIDFLLDRQPVDIADATPESPSSLTSVTPSGAKKTRLARLVTPLLKPWFGGRPATPPRDGVSLQSPSRISQRDKRRQALRLITRLRQPFGALLFTQVRQNVPVYRRVAADSMITVQVQDNTPLQNLLENVRLLDVL